MPPFKFSTHIEVRFRDLDALGHVNNAVYLTYFEIARLHYWKKLFGNDAFHRHSFVVVRAECNYRSPAYSGEVLYVFARASFLSTKLLSRKHAASSRMGQRFRPASTPKKIEPSPFHMIFATVFCSLKSSKVSRRQSDFPRIFMPRWGATFHEIPQVDFQR